MEAATSSAQIETMSSWPAPATTPMVNIKESPGKNRPTSRPVSAKTIPASSAYPSQPVTTCVSRWIRRSGSVRLLQNSSSAPVTASRLAVAGGYALNGIGVHPGLPFAGQLSVDAVQEQRVAFLRLLLLQLQRELGALRGQPGLVRPHLPDDFRNDKPALNIGWPQHRALGLGESLGDVHGRALSLHGIV